MIRKSKNYQTNMKTFFAITGIIAAIILFVIFLIVLPVDYSDWYKNGTVVCRTQQEFGFYKKTETCYTVKLDPTYERE